ncbi:MAG: ABC transporter permease [Prevotella sp.]|nr:ABC transporter permease [Prevotella sp.]
MVAVCIIAISFSSRFLVPSNLINILRQVAANTILGMGFTFVLASGNIDLSVGSMIGMLGVITGLTSKIPGMPFGVALLFGAVIGILSGLFNAVFSAFFGLPAFVVTLATAQIYKGTCYLLSRNAPITSLPEQFKFIGSGDIIGIPVPVWILCVVVIISATLMYKTKFGRHVIARGGNSEAARVCGINVKRISLLVYSIAGFCSFISSTILTGRAFSAQPTAGSGMEMDTIAAVVIGGTALKGGTGNVVGTIFGCLMIGIINNMLNLAAVDSNWQFIAKGFLIIFAILIDVQTERVYSKISLSKKTA